MRIGDNPRAAPLRPKWGKSIRGVVFGRYLIAYRVEEDLDEVVILRVIHGARNIGRIKM